MKPPNTTYDVQLTSIQTEIELSGSIAKMVNYHYKNNIAIYMMIRVPGILYRIQFKVESVTIVRSAPEFTISVHLKTCHKDI